MKTVLGVLGFVDCHLVRDSDGDGWLSEEDARELEKENERLKLLASNEDSRCRNADNRLVCEYWMKRALDAEREAVECEETVPNPMPREDR